MYRCRPHAGTQAGQHTGPRVTPLSQTSGGIIESQRYRAAGRACSVCDVDEATWLDATAQADLVRRGEVSPKELAEAAIARIEAVNPKLDAVIRTRFDAA